MHSHDLIGKVAATRVERLFEQPPASRVLLGIMGLSPAIATAIAREVAAIPLVEGRIQSFLHPRLVEGEIGQAILSEDTATRHRNNAPDGVALTLFSVPAEDVKAVEQSLGHVDKIDEGWLKEEAEPWARNGLIAADAELRQQVIPVLEGLIRSEVVTDIRLLADFVLRVDRHMADPERLAAARAVRRALPALRLPRDAGDIRAKIEDGKEVAEAFFRQIHETARPALYLRSPDGEPLNPSDLADRLKDLVENGEISEPAASALDALINDPDANDGGWTPVRAAVAELPWEEIERLFTRERRKARDGFGQETISLFDTRLQETLSQSDKDLLKDIKRAPRRPSEAVDDFFARHREKLKADPKLYRKWEKVVFRSPIETSDLAEGLLRLALRTRQDAEDDRDSLLYIRLRDGDSPEFWTKTKNTRLCRVLRDRWRGLDTLLKPDIRLDLGRCWKDDWEKDVTREVTSGAKAAVEFEFEAFLVSPADLKDDGRPDEKALRQAPCAQMLWRSKPDAFITGFPIDLALIAPSQERGVALLTARVKPQRYSRYGAVQSVDLGDRTTVFDVNGGSEGILAAPGRSEGDVARMWREGLDTAVREGIVTPEQQSRLDDAFEAFRDAYASAIAALRDGDGLADPAIIAQAERYGDLLATLASDAYAEVTIRSLWDPVLRIGMAHVEAARPTAIVSGWAPLRLAEIGAKARLLAEAMRKVAASPTRLADEIATYVETQCAALKRTFYLDVGFAPGTPPTFLVESRRRDGMSLLEPATGDKDVLADEPAEDTVKAFERVADEYLKLRPHERANFSTVLFDTESDTLPAEIARSMSKRIDGEPDFRCDLVLSHQNPASLRRIYEQQNRRIGHEVDGALTSEAARTFLSRLRVGIVSPEMLGNGSGKGHDIILLQDVISRRAEVRWARVVASDRPDLATHVPSAHTKRKPFRRGATTSGTYLTSPSQPDTARIWLDALHDVIDGRASGPGDPWLPMQDVEFRTGEVDELLKTAHRLGTWVMTYDRLADRRLVASDRRRIVRYFSDPRSDHNVIVSAEISERDLGERLRSDLEYALPDAPAEDCTAIARAIHRNAASLSGAIVMRGAQRLNHAHELLGLVLTQREIELLLATRCEEHHTAWFFLDDVASWLDLSARSRADILAVDFAMVGGEPSIRLIVGEAKYVREMDLGEQRAKSLGQLKDTWHVLRKRLAELDGTLDPEIWRARLADLVLEHIEPFDRVGGLDLDAWIAGLRAGRFPVDISGHSLVFAHDRSVEESDPMVPDEYAPPGKEIRPLAQWTFGRAGIAKGLRSLVDEVARPQIFIPSSWPAQVARKAADVESDPPNTVTEEPTPVPELAEGAPVIEIFEPPSVGPVEATPSRNVPEGWQPEIFEVVAAMSRADDEARGREWLAEQVTAVQRAIQREGEDAPVLGSRLTPNTGLIYLGGHSVTVSWLERKQTDLLTRHGLDIVRITPMPGRIAVGVRRPERAVLHLADSWLRRKLEPTAPEANTALLLGEKEDDGELFYLPLSGDFAGQERAAPHSLISGTTGSGKGILATNLLLDTCAFNSPKAVEVHLIDPKQGVDYAWAEHLPHLRGGIVSEKGLAVSRLRGLVEEMELRYAAIRAAGCANIEQFNRRASPGDRMARVIILFDEVANWMQDNDFKQEIDSIINEIATKARAAGLHLFMIYQRADVQVMTMQLRTNLGNKLILRLGDRGSSEIALGEKGAERLLGRGHVIGKLGNDDKVYGQIPYIGENEVQVLAETICRAWG